MSPNTQRFKRLLALNASVIKRRIAVNAGLVVDKKVTTHVQQASRAETPVNATERRGRALAVPSICSTSFKPFYAI
jgi:hypothetical protein